MPWSVKLLVLPIAPSCSVPGSCQGHWSMLLLTFTSCHLLTLCFVKPRLNKHASQNMHAPQITSGVWAAPPHPEFRGFSSNASSCAVSFWPTLRAGKGSILHCSTFLSSWFLWSSAFSFLYMLALEWRFSHFFTSTVSVLCIISNLKALTKRMIFKKYILM